MYVLCMCACILLRYIFTLWVHVLCCTSSIYSVHVHLLNIKFQRIYMYMQINKLHAYFSLDTYHAIVNPVTVAMSNKGGREEMVEWNKCSCMCTVCVQ